jgi:hypothetical protein
MPFDAMSYGETLAKKWEKHPLHHGHQMRKAWGRATRATKKWEGEWEFTHLPEPDEVAGGVGADEEAATGRWIREREATHKAVKQ